MSEHLSEFGAGSVSAAQRLAEIVCQRRARLENRPIGPKFWNEATWKRTYIQQLQGANRLLKVYSEGAIFKMLGEKGSIYSLLPGWVAEEVAKVQERMNMECCAADRSTPIEVTTTMARPREGRRRNNSVRARLKGL